MEFDAKHALVILVAAIVARIALDKLVRPMLVTPVTAALTGATA